MRHVTRLVLSIPFILGSLGSTLNASPAADPNTDYIVAVNADDLVKFVVPDSAPLPGDPTFSRTGVVRQYRRSGSGILFHVVLGLFPNELDAQRALGRKMTFAASPGPPLRINVGDQHFKLQNFLGVRFLNVVVLWNGSSSQRSGRLWLWL